MTLFFKIGLLSLFLVAAPFLSPAKPVRSLHTFRVALQQEIHTLDPLRSIDSASISLLYLTQRGLFKWSSSGETELDLAEAYEISHDGKCYRFRLKDLTWSDGTPITATDFESSWKRALDPKNTTPNTPYFFVLGNAKSIFLGEKTPNTLKVHALTDRILEVELEEPYPPFLQLLTTAPFFPYKLNEHTQALMSSGFYEIVKFEPLNRMQLISRDPSNKLQLELKWIPDEMSALQFFLSGEIDFVGLPFSRLPSDLPPSLSERQYSHVLLANYALLINPDKPALRSSDSREKIAIALREVRWEDLSDSEISSSTDYLVPLSHTATSTPNSVPRALLPIQRFQENDQNGEELVLLITMGSLNRKVAQVIHQKLLEHQIHIKIRLVDSKGYFLEMRQGNFDLCLTWFSIQYPSPFSVLGRFTGHSFQRQLFPLKHPEFDRLYLLALQSQDQLTSHQYLNQAERLLIDEAICIPLFTPSSVALISKPWSIGYAPSGFVDLLQLENASAE